MEVAVYFTVLGMGLLMTAGLLRALPTLRTAVLGMEAGRLATLDGMRGILALSVLLHHSMLGFFIGQPQITRADLNSHPFVAQLGPVSVGLFFLISAYLFGGRLLRSGGQLDAARFLIGRVTRLAPLYVAVISAVIAISIARQHFVLVEPVQKVAREAARYFSFGFLPRYSLNGWEQAPDVIGMVWSLKYEWLLYCLLPPMAYLYRLIGHVAALYVPLLCLGAIWSAYFFLFAAGIAVAQIVAARKPASKPAWAGAALIALTLLIMSAQGVYGWCQPILLVPVLVATIHAAGPFRLLAFPVLRYLGEISYSIYLTHGLVLFATGLSGFDPHGSEAAYLLLASGQIMTTIALSSVTFLLFEKPFMRALPRALAIPRAWLPISGQWHRTAVIKNARP